MACVVSHKYKFIFIHVPKTGGTSFMSPWSPYVNLLGSNDVVLRQHYTAKYLKETYPGAWRKYFRFVTIRNPWDRAISLWLTTKPNLPLSDFLNKVSLGNLSAKQNLFTKPQAFWTGMDVHVVHAVRYEDYDTELSWVIGKVGLPLRYLSQVRKTPIRLTSDYRNYYDEESACVCASIYEQDIGLWNYSY